MVDYAISEISYTSIGNVIYIKNVSAFVFNNTTKKPLIDTPYKLKRDQVISSIRAGKSFGTFLKTKGSKKPKIVNNVFIKKIKNEIFLKTNPEDVVPGDHIDSLTKF